MTKSRCVCNGNRPQAFAKRPRVSRVLGSRNGRETKICRHFFGLCVANVSTNTGIGMFLVAKRRTNTFGLALGLRVSKVFTITGIGMFLFAKRRTVVTFGLVFGLRVSKLSTITGIGMFLIAKCETLTG